MLQDVNNNTDRSPEQLIAEAAGSPEEMIDLYKREINKLSAIISGMESVCGRPSTSAIMMQEKVSCSGVCS